MTELPDSGNRRQFATGSQRDTGDNKGRFDLISPFALRRLALHLERGAKKYNERNWEKGQPFSQFMASAMRHLNKFQAGYRNEDHLAAAVWNLMAIMHFEETAIDDPEDRTLYYELNDLPYPERATQEVSEDLTTYEAVRRLLDQNRRAKDSVEPETGDAEAEPTVSKESNSSVSCDWTCNCKVCQFDRRKASESV